MSKSKLRFSSNHDFNTPSATRFYLIAEGSVWAHGIWDLIRFANCCDSIWIGKISGPTPLNRV